MFSGQRAIKTSIERNSKHGTLKQKNFEIKLTVEHTTEQAVKIGNRRVETMPRSQSINASKIIAPGFSRKRLIPLYEKTRMWRTVLERRLDFSNMDQSKAQSLQENSDASLGMLQSHEMELGSFQTNFQNNSQKESSNFSNSILSDAQMAYNSFETSGSKININYLLKRLQNQILLHNTLLDASEKFPKSASIENLVKECMKGTVALDGLKQRVSAYKNAKQSAKTAVPKAALQEIPSIIHNTINCAEDLQTLSEEITQMSGFIDANLMNRSSLTAQSIKDASKRLREIEQLWANMPTPEEEGSSLGILHESELQNSERFLDGVSASLNTIFAQLNHSLEEVLQTPNTQSLNELKQNLQECKELLSDITRNHSLLLDETMPSLVEPQDTDDISLLNIVSNELDKSCQSEIEAFLKIWKKPEMEQFLDISKQTIDDLSSLRYETKEMLGKMVASNGHAKQTPHRRQYLTERLNVLRDDATTQKPIYTSIIMKDYIDEDDLCAEQEGGLPQEFVCQAEPAQRTVKFIERFDESTHPAPKCSPNSDHFVKNRLQMFMQEMDKFQQNYLNSKEENTEHNRDMVLIEKKLDDLMAMISEVVNTLRSN
ncbi:uncharacterized protein LOC128296840 [Anopheles moucheti]|uniref:uncharacterized protein LOC128296840 n=1 Tax=Anopheles moucheti TaxID=186751 RepID=UPI0022EFF5BD|nr:uncharacterized protein LOC128296840 [Anopheles moucheti]